MKPGAVLGLNTRNLMNLNLKALTILAHDLYVMPIVVGASQDFHSGNYSRFLWATACYSGAFGSASQLLWAEGP